MSLLNTLADAFLWPDTKLCLYFGIKPTDEMGLMRSFLNTLVWLPLGLLVAYYCA
ncbi:hypothetical protein GCM10008927_16410 [Amylibacter ulvae]|uniref:Uncharacterized protein n=1 Tax=Paramylibacter ulvae TaxID=1651968 RepID=A0ABQ3D2C6_9RHOB|nr:hypothetical protein GCM10008927_16410 [Amylibacter ulvae]